jgi:hypothetical protein
VEMERSNPVWTGRYSWFSAGHDDTACVGLKGGVVVQDKSEFWCHLLAISFIVGFILGYGVAAYVAVMLGR